MPWLLNERVCPLCDDYVTAPIASFPWTLLNDDLDYPPRHHVHQFVSLLASRLGLTAKDLVVAQVLMEEALRGKFELVKPRASWRGG